MAFLHSLAVLALFFSTLVIRKPHDSRSASLILWLLRAVTFSLLFRSFLGPTILRLISNRLRVQSVSLRSIRGIYFRAGKGILHVDRVGLSYHRPSGQSASRFSIRVEGFRLELVKPDQDTSRRPTFASPPETQSRKKMAKQAAARTWVATRSLTASAYSTLEPYVRPILRKFVVSAFRLMIRALPALTQVLDLEVDSFVITSPTIVPGAELVWSKAKVHTSIAFTQLDNSKPGSTSLGNGVPGAPRHRRFASVADLNTRIKNSFRRTWDRAWGSTHVAASVLLDIHEVSGFVSRDVVVKVKGYAADGAAKRKFVSVPNIIFSTSVHLDPRQQVEKHGLEVSFSAGAASVDADIMQHILAAFKTLKAQKEKECILDGPLSSPSSMSSSPPPQSPPLSPRTSRIGWASQISPTSPLMGALSARFKWTQKQQAAVRVRSSKIKTGLSIIKNIRIDLVNLTLTHCGILKDENDVSAGTYAASLQSISFHTTLSHPDRIPLHREWLGRTSAPGDPLTADVYAISFSIQQVSLDRKSKEHVEDHLRVVELGPIQATVLTSHWPAPWLQGPSFLSGDPNAQFLVLRFSFGTLEITERLEIIEELLKKSKSKATSHPVEKPSLLPPVLSPVPRLSFGMHISAICIRLISSGTQECNPFALEARTDGFVTSASTQFQILPDAKVGRILADPDRPRLHMDIRLHAELQRTFVNVNLSQECLIDEPHDVTSLVAPPGEPVFSLDTVQLVGVGHAMGEMADEVGGGVVVDTASTFLDLHCATDALSIELWQPDAMMSLRAIVMALQRDHVEQHTAPSTSKHLLGQLPTGIAISVALSRMMLFVTSPDLAPDEELNISRGVAFHMGTALHFCAVRSQAHVGFSELLSRTQKRLQLSLPTELLATAAGGSAASAMSQSERALVQIIVWDAAFRDALSTRFVADDPFGVGDTSEDYRSQEYLRIDQITLGMVLSGRRSGGMPLSDSKDDCAISIAVSTIKGYLHLAHAYNILLAAQALKSLLPPRTPVQRPSQTLPSTLAVILQCDVERVQLVWEFPLRMKLYTRITGLSVQKPLTNSIKLGWQSIVMAVPTDVDRDGVTRKVWEELVRLMNFTVEVIPHTHPVKITVKGDSARLRIPFDYVLADLILDISMTMKGMKHLVHMVPTGKFANPPTPEAEEAKKMPDLTVRIGTLIAEAADDTFESRLGTIWRAGFEAARLRLERDDAFRAKADAILTADNNQEPSTPAQDRHSEFQFSAEHTVGIAEAHARLQEVHSGAWKSHIKQARAHQAQRQRTDDKKAYDASEELVDIVPPPPLPPLCRLTFAGMTLHLTGPSFSLDKIPDFLYREGSGLPLDTQFSLLVPLHLSFSLSSLRIDSREYSLPMLNVPAHSNKHIPGLLFDSDIVVAEEMGTENSVEWIDCAIVKPHTGLHGASPLHVTVPKTLMPVKTYANPLIRVKTDDVTDFAWGVSYGPVTQDIMRVVDTLSHAPRDSSPPIGFWDKLKLVFHWRLRVLFESDVHLHMKGSHDPHGLRGNGAGFALCWEGGPQLLIGQKNEQNEVIQMISESVSVIIPNIEQSYGVASTGGLHSRQNTFMKANRPRKICAKFGSGSRFGVGIVLERSCGHECTDCHGDAFHRQCRFFDFKPHYDVKLERKAHKPEEKGPDDSYNGFRSDFIHMSISLTSSLLAKEGKHSSIHLSPAVFAHFWSWWSLFDAKSLPIRQGCRYKHKRPLSPKFGQHLATIKYAFDVPRLFLTHVYRDDSKDAWTDGVTPFVGVKAMIGRFTADMHQRAQESTITTPSGVVKTVIHKQFYAVEVVMVELDLRALMAIFSDPLKQHVAIDSTHPESSYRSQENIPDVGIDSPWADLDDFRDPEWIPSSTPVLHVLPMVSCPRFTYFKRTYASSTKDRVEITKFGDEETHVCYLGKEPSVPAVQMDLAQKRIAQLQAQIASRTEPGSPNSPEQAGVDTKHMISLLEDYVRHLQAVERESRTSSLNGPLNYYMPSDSVSPDEWAEFDNVYQVHCPRIYFDNIIRDIMLQYYYCSRTRRGFEYHMATRAVKFIRDQAQEVMTHIQTEIDQDKHRGAAASAQAAAQAVRKILTGAGDAGPKTSIDVSSEPLGHTLGEADPMKGWAEGVSLEKGHFCLLLKPQLVLRSEASTESVCVLAAVQGKLQSYNIMDDANVDDPVSGKIMSRNYASLMGLQAFSPSAMNKTGENVVPLEVLIDLRCASNFFDRLVPQTDAILHYDKFNRLRLRNTTATTARTHSNDDEQLHNHLHSQNDLVRIHVPRFTVSANDRHFQAISNIVTNLILFSNVAHKTRSDRLEKMLFSYDFTNLSLAADVISKLQYRLRQAVETKREAEIRLRGHGDPGEVEKLKIDAHIQLLAEELDYVFEAIKLAQDKAEDRAAQKSALLLHASSNEISWRMIGRHDQLLAKLAVRDIDFRWLNRQDGSTINNLTVGDLQAFDGAADAEWTEILSKYDESSSHPLTKRKLFCVAAWTVLPPVGGITIYEGFELNFHPMRLQIDTRVGGKIMEYLWPARRSKRIRASTESTAQAEELRPPSSGPSSPLSPRAPVTPLTPSTPRTPAVRRASIDMVTPKSPSDPNMLAVPSLRKTATSRSFTDLRKAATDTLQVPSPLHRTKSSDALITLANSASSGQVSKSSEDRTLSKNEADDAAVMKTRASQKTFVWVKVSSLHLMLSIQKEDSFLCRDARIRTRDLEYRNQTWSFEELVDQFIPSGKNWKGWLKIAFQQPLVPVLPVARELISKTKWVKGHHSETPKRSGTPKAEGASRTGTLIPKRLRTLSSMSRANTPPGAASLPREDGSVSALGLVTDPEASMSTDQDEQRRPQKRHLLKVFKRRRSSSRTRGSLDSVSSASVSESSNTRTSYSHSPSPKPGSNHANSEPLS